MPGPIPGTEDSAESKSALMEMAGNHQRSKCMPYFTDARMLQHFKISEIRIHASPN